jgi:hypothetical protein
VSIQLEAVARGSRPLEARAGDMIVINTRRQKIGKTLGFVSVTVLGSDNQTLLDATHIKYMPSKDLWAGHGVESSLDLIGSSAWRGMAWRGVA